MNRKPRFERHPLDPLNLLPGDRVAGYRVEKKIGAGGAGAVYLAIEESLGRQVALKILVGDDPGDDLRFRFLQEAKAATAVDHPNIIPVYAAGESENHLLYIAMRYVNGGDVRSLLAREGRLSPERAVAITAAVASALDDAHEEAGIVHRDVKPANMLLDFRSGGPPHVYLADFGITRTVADTTNPLAQATVGTPSYMAPEQFASGMVDSNADQYSLASSAFEMLSGAPPFRRDVLSQLATAVQFEDPPALSSRRPGLPAAVDRVFARALAKEPGDRYPSCGHFAVSLGEALGLTPLIASDWIARETSRWTRSIQEDDDPSAESAAPSRPKLDAGVKEEFKYVHGPSHASTGVFYSPGHDGIINEIDRRVRHSHGGAFLITGFRGVGKSTVVMRAIDAITEVCVKKGEEVIQVKLTVARSMEINTLLFAIVRRIFETLQEKGLLEKLPQPTQRALFVAYMRTSLSYKETDSRQSQRSAELDLGLGAGKLVKAVADIAGPKVKLSASRTQSLATEATFLSYSETDVEYDLMRIIELVSTASVAAGITGRLPWRRRTLWPAVSRLRLVIILDEVDKITGDGGGLIAVEKLLGGAKNVLATSGAYYFIIAGPDLHDRAILDTARGSGVYESVFAWRRYVPCLWDAPKELLAGILSDPALKDDARVNSLEYYLRFKARGIPRRLRQEVNQFVDWAEQDQPRLQVSAAELERVAFYAQLERIMQVHIDSSGQDRHFQEPLDIDRWRLGNYYIVDWVLQSDGEPFTATELLRQKGKEDNFDPLLRISRQSTERLLGHLADYDVLIPDSNTPMSTVLSDVEELAEKRYRLADEVCGLLQNFAVAREAERAARKVRQQLDAEPFTSSDWTDTLHAFPARRSKIAGGRYEYELDEIIEQSALSVVYKGQDQLTGRPVSLKLLLPALRSDQVARARFQREIEITSKLDHQQVIHAYDVLDGPDDYGLVLERLLGPTLDELVAQNGAMSPAEVVGIGQSLAEALTYLSRKGVVRLDLKPNSIVMANRGPVIRDLGIALEPHVSGSTLTKPGVFIGTPAFMAPEAIGDHPVDARADIYALGLVMFYCLGGKTPWDGVSIIPTILNRIRSTPIDPSALPVSPQFRAVLSKATALDPRNRFQGGASFAKALRETPEWQDLRGHRNPGTTLVD